MTEETASFFLLVQALELQPSLHLKGSTYLLILIRERDEGGGGTDALAVPKGNGGRARHAPSQLGRVNGHNFESRLPYDLWKRYQ